MPQILSARAANGDGKDGDEPWVILVGTKALHSVHAPQMQLRFRPAPQMDVCDGVSRKDQLVMGERINACALVETSAQSRDGVDMLQHLIMTLASMKHNNESRPPYVSGSPCYRVLALTFVMPCTQGDFGELQELDTLNDLDGQGVPSPPPLTCAVHI
jgi:hypothetical protein